MKPLLLTLSDVHTYIDEQHILQGVDVAVPAHGCTVILGRNGAGKTTTLRSIMGLWPVASGDITFDGEAIDGLPPHRVARRGIGYVPEHRGIFQHLSVRENLVLAHRGGRTSWDRGVERVTELFPDLAAAWRRPGGTLSGGQQQMLALGRALVNDNRLLVVDEPSTGLAPILVQEVVAALQQIKGDTPILLVEQNFGVAAALGEDCFILDNGATVYRGTMADIAAEEELKQTFLGIS